MKVFSILSLVIALGIGGNYLAQKSTQPIVIQKEEGVAPLEKARRATFLITLPAYNVGGSAILVGRKKIDSGGYRYTALTAYHIIKEMAQKIAENKIKANHEMELMFQPNFHDKPLRIKLDIDDIGWAIPAHDWAAIVFDMDHKLGCVEVATKEEFKAILPFEKIYAVGYGGGYGQQCRDGIIGTTHNEHENIQSQIKGNLSWDIYPNKFFRPYISIWYGDSGGGVYNKEGKLIGIINGFDMISRGWNQMPVAHSTVAFKAYIVRDTLQYNKDFFLVED